MPPRYSIVIPTRSRADLLGCAIRSALAQTFDDVEILVSDNASSDHTPAVVESFSDPRIRYVRAPRPLVMPESWAFALSHAQGEFVTFLCDDDALHPRALHVVEHIASSTAADVLYWRWCHYHYAQWSGSATGDVFSFGPPFSDRAFRVNTAALLDRAFDMRLGLNSPAPRMLNAAVHRSLLARIGAQLFRPISPDWSALVALAQHSQLMVFLDAPLLVAGASSHSIGASAVRRGEAAKAYIREIKSHYPGLILPPATCTPVCWLAQVFLQCAADNRSQTIGETGCRNDVNLVHMLAIAGQELEGWQRSGIAIQDLKDEYSRASAELSDEQQVVVRQIVRGRRALAVEDHIGELLQRDVLGCGRVMAEGGSAQAVGYQDITEYAMEIDQWLAERGVDVGKMLDDVYAAAGGRKLLLYGVGANGWALRRCMDEMRSGQLWCFDDRNDGVLSGCSRLREVAELNAANWYVIVTPTDGSLIEQKLTARGFYKGRDYMKLGEAGVVEQAGAAGA